MPMNITGMGETLLDSMAEECTLIDPRTVQTPTGGYGQALSDSVTFTAVIRKDNTLPARVAEKQGVKELYTVVVPKGFPFRYHSVFRRHKDGLTYRVTSNIADNEAPERSSIKVGSVTAERWDIPNA